MTSTQVHRAALDVRLARNHDERRLALRSLSMALARLVASGLTDSHPGLLWEARAVALDAKRHARTHSLVS